jgi:hypothetical protein
LFSARPAALTPINHLIAIAGAACYALATWSATLAVIGIALRFLSGFSLARRYIADGYQSTSGPKRALRCASSCSSVTASPRSTSASASST